MAREAGESRRAVRGRAGALGVCVLLCLAVSPAGEAATSVVLGDVTITLQSARYYRNGDYTRFVYEVKAPPGKVCPYWILQTCAGFESALWFTSPVGQDVDEPLQGLKFSPWLRNQKFYLYAGGQWGVSETRIGAYSGPQAEGRFVTGWIDGPACGASSLAITVAAGADVAFPEITGPGSFAALNGTTLRVESTAAGWSLGFVESFVVPEGASVDVVADALEVAVAPYANGAGSTDVSVQYVLHVGEADLDALPEGVYEITITCTVTLD